MRQQQELKQQQGLEQQREQQLRDEGKKSASFVCNILYLYQNLVNLLVSLPQYFLKSCHMISYEEDD